MVHGKGGDGHVRILVDHPVPGLADVEAVGREGRRRMGHVALAVVDRAVVVIQGIGGIEPAHDPRHALRSVDGQGSSPAGHPGLHPQLSQVSDMVGVIVGEEHTGDPVQGKAHQLQGVDRAGARVHQIGLALHDHRRAGPGPRRVRHGRTGPAQHHPQGRGVEQVRPGQGGLQAGLNALFEKPGDEADGLRRGREGDGHTGQGRENGKGTTGGPDHGRVTSCN